MDLCWQCVVELKQNSLIQRLNQNGRHNETETKINIRPDNSVNLGICPLQKMYLAISKNVFISHIFNEPHPTVINLSFSIHLGLVH